MKYICIVFLLMFSCYPNKVDNSGNFVKEPVQDENYMQVLSPKKTYVLYYESKEEIRSPVKNISYFVVQSKDRKVVKKLETVTADKIYWKSDSTLAIIPYREMVKAETEVGSPNQNDEILINIK